MRYPPLVNDRDLESNLKKALLPKYGNHVRGVVTRRVIDSPGDPAVWIWVILKDYHLLETGDRTEIDNNREAAAKAARQNSSEWPYVTFRTEAEQREMEAEARRS